MEFLLGIVIGLAVGLMVRKNSGSYGAARSVIRRELEVSAQAEKDEAIAAGIRKAALQVGNPDLYSNGVAKPQPEAVHPEPPQGEAVERPIWSRDIQRLDSVSVLLYFGAFLMVAGVGLFVGLSDFSGAVKTAAVLILALVLYGAGLLMHQAMPRLRPVALALTAVGLICLPLTGVAAYFYATDASAGPFIWFMTSLCSLLLYVFALWRIRQSLLGYLSIFMCVSLWLSIVSVIDAPVYYFGWAAIVLGMMYLLATRYLKPWSELEAPLSVSATVMVPAALILTFLFGAGTVSLTNLGITTLLAAGFYALAIWQEKNEQVQTTYFAISYSLVPVAVLLLAQEYTHNLLTLGWILSITSVVELAAAHAWRTSHPLWYRAALVASAATLGISSIMAPPYLGSHTDWALYCWLLGFNAVVHGLTAFVGRHRLHALMGLLAFLALPSIVGYVVVVPALPVLTMSSIYLMMAAMLMVAGHRIRSFGFYDLTQAIYALALLIAWLIGLTGTTWVPMGVSLAVGALVTVAAVYEKLPSALYGSTAFIAVALVQLFAWQQPTEAWILPLSLGGLSLAYYLKSKILARFAAYARPLLLSGLAGMYLASLLGFAVTGTSWTTVTLLLAAGALTSYEAYATQQRSILYVGGGVMLTALQMGMYLIHIREAEVYWHMWALYFAGLAWLAHRSQRQDEKQSFTIFALAFQTLPLAWQALDGDTGLGFLLLGESIVLMLFGLNIKYRLVAWWGLAAAVGSVLYQLREFQFFVLVVLGAGIIGLGVYLLLRQEKKQ